MTPSAARSDGADPGAAGLCVRGVHKAYGATTVLRGVDLDVTPGSLTAVLGRSGCGKTTLLRVVAGFDTPDSGTVSIDGRQVAGPGGALAAEDRRIGYVTQEGTLFPHLTVGANVVFGLPWRERRARHRVPELLELVGLGAELTSRYPHELSGGQQQRVALARALAPRPGLLLLDEPFSSLDAELRVSTRRAVAAALEAAGTTAVLVTHDQAEALSMAGRVAVVRDGLVVQEATPDELYRNPVDLGVAAFVGEVVALPGVVTGGSVRCALGEVEVGPGAAAGRTTALLRPEQIGLVADGAGVGAHVLGLDYFGHDAVVRLGLESGPEVVARCSGHALPRLGDRVGLVVHGRAALDATEAAAAAATGSAGA